MSVNVGMTPHVLFVADNAPATSDWFYVCKDPSNFPPVINGNVPVFPLGCMVLSVPDAGGQYDANELYLETLAGAAPGNGHAVRYGGNFTAKEINAIGFFRVQKGTTGIPTGAAIQAYGNSTSAED